MTDVVASHPGPEGGGGGGDGRGGRAWWVAVPLVLGVLVYGALRPPGGGDPAASPSPAVSDGRPGLVEETSAEPTATPVPVPRLSAPTGPRVRVVVTDQTTVAVDGRVVFRTRPDDSLHSFTPLRDGFAAVVVEEPFRSANPATLVVADGARMRRIVVDEGTRVVQDATAESFWSVGPGGTAQRRGRDGAVLARERVPAPWTVAAGSVSGLVVVDEGRFEIGLLRGGRVERLATGASLAATTGTHVAWSQDCPARCAYVVRDVRTRDTWSVRAPRTLSLSSIVTLSPRGDAIAFVGLRADAMSVFAARRGGEPIGIVDPPENSVSIGYYDVDWVEGDRVAVVEVTDGVRAFVYDVAARRLTYVGAYGAGLALEVYADPP